MKKILHCCVIVCLKFLLDPIPCSTPYQQSPKITLWLIQYINTVIVMLLGTPSKSLSSSDVTNSSRATDSPSHSLGDIISEDVSRDVIPDGFVDRVQSRNIKQNREPRVEAHLRGDAIQLGLQNDENKSKTLN